MPACPGACMIATQHKTALAVKALAVLPASTAGAARPRARSQAERGQACELGIGVQLISNQGQAETLMDTSDHRLPVASFGG